MAAKTKVKTFKFKHSHEALIAIFVIAALFVAIMLSMSPTAKTEAGQGAEVTTTPPAAGENVTAEKVLNYTYPTGIAPPSLKITSFINTPTFPKTGDTDLIRIYVKNVGSDAEATTATLKMNNEVIATLAVPALERNAQAVLEYDWIAPAAGDYTFEVNITAVPGEKYLDDNYGKITITVM